MIQPVMVLGVLLAQQPAPASSPVLDAMQTELTRSLATLRAQPTPPYFLAYDISDVTEYSIRASFGSITERDEERRRVLNVELRTGTYTFDNTHAARTEFADFSRFTRGPTDIPIDDDPLAIRTALWRETEQQYWDAVEQLNNVRMNAGLRVAPEDSSPDFSRERPERYTEPVRALAVDRRAWEERLRRFTAPFARHPGIYGGNAVLLASVETHWYVNSEGTVIQTSQPGYRLYLQAFSKADDGMELPRYESFFAVTPEGMPDDSTVLRAVDRMIADLDALRRAPTIEPYTGPAILSGRASAVFFHEILGHRLEGHRQRNEDEAQTFTRRVSDAVLPPGFSVYFDPTLRQIQGTDLAGHYRYDDEGVRAQRVAVIDRGVLRTFLMSRRPIAGVAQSNGHGRRQVGFSPVARQSSLIVEVDAPRTRARLKQMLIEEIRRQRKPFGLLFDDIEGGFTITTRGFPNAFEVLPIMVYRIFPDGREELVRGVDLIGTPLTVFSKVTAGDDRVEVFNGLCGAESGLVPVSAVSPAVLVSQIEVQKKPKATERAPILPPPPLGAGPIPDTGDVVLRAMRDELARSMAELRLDTLPRPYFLSYRIDEPVQVHARGALGSLVTSGAFRARRLSVELRVGDYAFDNSNFVGMPPGISMDFLRGMEEEPGVPLDDDYGGLRRLLWLATDDAYKEAVGELSQKRAALANRTRRDSLPDFSREEVVTLRDEAPAPRLDRAAVEALVRDVSAAFRETPEIHASGVNWSGGAVRTWYVNSEGTSFTRLSPWGSVDVTAATLTTDGLPLAGSISEYAATGEGLPGREALRRRASDLGARLTLLRGRPPVESYNGPVLFEGRAAAELVAMILSPQLIAERQPAFGDAMFERLSGGGASPEQLGARVLPRAFSVTDNPTRRTFEGKSIGGFLVDDEGVRARETKLVERGILRTLLNTRTPVRGVPRSTGSRRGSRAAVGNLFVTSDSGLPEPQLRRRLLAAAAEHGNGYAIVVRRLGTGGFGSPRDMFRAMRSGEMTLPVEDAVKVFPDGREEPLRDVMISGVTAASFKDILAASRSRAVVTLSPRGAMAMIMAMLRVPQIARFMGSRFGSSSTYVVPSLLFDDVAVRAPTGDGERPPVLPPPWKNDR